MDFLAFILASLAVWRLVSMLQEETGPAGIFARFRAFLAKKDNGELGSLYDGYTCFMCMSVWWAFIITFLLPNANVAQFILNWFAVSAGAIIVHLVTSRLEQ